jgi:hypothetical protein
MKKVILLCFSCLFVFPTLAQQPQLVRERNYLITPLGCDVMASAPDGAGNILYSGVAALGTSSKLENKFLMVKPNADTLWTWRNPLKLDYNQLALQALSPGKFLAGGNINSGPTIAMSLQQINSNKTFGWSKNYVAVPSMVYTILPMPGKDLLLGGSYQKEFAFTRTDSLGNVKWSRSYTWGTWGDRLIDMKMAKNGNIIALGNTDKPFGPNHVKLMLINQNGDSLLGRQLVVHGINRDEFVGYNFNSVTPLSDGGYLITADVDTITSTYPNGTRMGMLVKVDRNLNMLWHKEIRNAASDFYMLTKTRELTDGSLLVLGYKYWPKQNSNIFQLYRFSPNGQLLATYPFTSSICTSLLITSLDALPDSTYMIGGSCGNNPPVSYGFYVAKVKIPGLPQPMAPMLPGWLTGISADQNQPELYLGQSYPNPTAETAIIPYTLPVSSKQAQIIIRDITGREIEKYEIRKNSSSLEVNLSNLHNGLYTYTLVADGKPIGTKKLAVMK